MTKRADLNQCMDDLQEEKYELEDKLDDSKVEIQQLKVESLSPQKWVSLPSLYTYMRSSLHQSSML